MIKQISDNEIYLLIKYIRSVLWRLAKRLSYKQDARFLKGKGAARQKTLHKSLFILKYYETFKALGRRKQHVVLNVSISFVSSVELFPWWS